jgi:hypothetical protein
MLGEAGDKLEIFQAADQQKSNGKVVGGEGENGTQSKAQSL